MPDTKLTPQTLRQLGPPSSCFLTDWRHTLNTYADAWEALENRLRTTEEVLEALRLHSHSAISQARTLAFQMQQSALAGTDPSSVPWAAWVIEKTTRLLEILQ